jgi:hypothetical protein
MGTQSHDEWRATTYRKSFTVRTREATGKAKTIKGSLSWQTFNCYADFEHL